MNKRTSAMGIVLTQEPGTPMHVLLLCVEGEWVFPKGHVHRGETELAAAIREVAEEADVSVDASSHLGFVTEFSFYFGGEQALKVIRVHAFVIPERQGITANAAEGFSDGVWLTTEVAIARLTHDDARQALRQALVLAEGAKRRVSDTLIS